MYYPATFRKNGRLGSILKRSLRVCAIIAGVTPLSSGSSGPTQARRLGSLMSSAGLTRGARIVRKLCAAAPSIQALKGGLPAGSGPVRTSVLILRDFHVSKVDGGW